MTGFRGDKNKTIIFQNRSGNTPIIEIADDSFSNSPTEEAILTEGIAYIGRNAFSGCNKLHQVVLPISIEEIEDSAFENCSSLKSISLPMALKTIGDGALKGTGLRTIEIPKSVFWLGDGLVADCQAMEHVTIPENIGRIPDHMFEGCSNLKKVELHEKLGAIGERAFFGCSSLDFIVIPDSVKQIGRMLLPIQINSLLFNVLLALMQRSMPERTNSNISWYSISFRLSPAMRQRKRRFTVY